MSEARLPPGTWSAPPGNLSEWSSPAVSQEILGGVPGPLPIDVLRVCVRRLHGLRDALRGEWVGLAEERFGHLVDWLLAGLVARENVLLVGPPGVAKSEIAVRVFRWLGLAPPDPRLISSEAALDPDLLESWRRREDYQRAKGSYFFQYLLSRFTQPEELFGPVEIGLLRRGVLARVNFGQLTGPGVRAAFLDEVFKASSSILNTLLELMQNRRYFNWGGMVPSDLHFLVGASNELPGAFGAGPGAAAAEEFSTLHAFVDRFPLRLAVPAVSGEREAERPSLLSQAFDAAWGRERLLLETGSATTIGPLACVNDLLLAGRACADDRHFDPAALRRFHAAFVDLAERLHEDGTAPERRHLTWTISPRKLKALYKIARAHALLVDDGFAGDRPRVAGPELRELHVFDFVWDTPAAEEVLRRQVDTCGHDHRP